jgi:hypothetical protein
VNPSLGGRSARQSKSGCHLVQRKPFDFAQDKDLFIADRKTLQRRQRFLVRTATRFGMIIPIMGGDMRRVRAFHIGNVALINQIVEYTPWLYMPQGAALPYADPPRFRRQPSEG